MFEIMRWWADQLRRGGRAGPYGASEPDRGRETGSGERRLFDLADNTELTLDLLEDTPEWRERLVYKVLLRDRDHIDFSTSYQIVLPVETVREYEPGIRAGDRIRLLLPFALRPKQLLLDVDFAGHGGNHAALLLRDKIADIQAQHMLRLNGTAFDEESIDYSIFVGISGFLLSGWRDKVRRVEASRLEQRKLRRLYKMIPDSWHSTLLERFYEEGKIDRDSVHEEALVLYLNGDIEQGGITAGDVSRWLERLEPVRQRLVDALGEGENRDSCSECVLLAMPFMRKAPKDTGQIDELVDYYAGLVESMGHTALEAMAGYGRRWQAIIHTELPVGVPCTVKLSEQRPWHGLSRNTMNQEVAFGDAKTTHIEVKAADHGVEIHKPLIRDFTGKEGKEVGYLDEMRRTADSVAIYASDSRRPQNARIFLRARVSTGYKFLLQWIFYPLIVLAGVTVFDLPHTPNFVDSLALLIFPLTLIGAFVASRAPTSLTERLLLPWRVAMGAGIVVVWVLTVFRLILYSGT